MLSACAKTRATPSPRRATCRSSRGTNRVSPRCSSRRATPPSIAARTPRARPSSSSASRSPRLLQRLPPRRLPLSHLRRRAPPLACPAPPKPASAPLAALVAKPAQPTAPASTRATAAQPPLPPDSQPLSNCQLPTLSSRSLRQHQRKRTAPPRMALQLNPAFVGLHHVFDDGKPEA